MLYYIGVSLCSSIVDFYCTEQIEKFFECGVYDFVKVNRLSDYTRNSV